MRTELQFFGLLGEEDRDIMRKHFISIRGTSSFYPDLESAIRGSIDWESVKPDSVEWFYFENLLNEAAELKKNEKLVDIRQKYVNLN